MRRAAPALALALTACAAAPPSPAPPAALERAADALLAPRAPDAPPPDLFGLAPELEAWLAEPPPLGADPRARERFWGAWLLAQLHAEASLGDAFVYERSSEGGRVGGVGTRVSDVGSTRPSATAHLVAATWHAATARSLFEAAARDDGAALAGQLAGRDLDDADDNLQLLLLVVYSRLGFADEVARTFEGSPFLLDPEAALSLMESFELRRGLRPWVCRAAWEHLRAVDEPTAFRFGVLAVEGGDRFGRDLPRAEVERIERWIVRDATVMFVCPESRTPYLPGQRRSPVSGIPHYEYVAVERPSAD